MTKFIGLGAMSKYSQELNFQMPINISQLPKLLHIPESLADNLIVIRNHRSLREEDFISKDDEIYLFFAVMGG